MPGLQHGSEIVGLQQRLVAERDDDGLQRRRQCRKAMAQRGRGAVVGCWIDGPAQLRESGLRGLQYRAQRLLVVAEHDHDGAGTRLRQQPYLAQQQRLAIAQQQ